MESCSPGNGNDSRWKDSISISGPRERSFYAVCLAAAERTRGRRSQRAFKQTTDLVEKLRAQNVVLEELIIPDESHDLLRWSDWIRAYRATAEFFDRKLAASHERQ